MVDPVTVGAFVASAIGAGSGALTKGALGQAGKEAYEQLKAFLASWAGHQTADIEAKPDSKARQEVLAEMVDERPQEEQAQAKALTAALVEALRQQVAREGPTSIDIGKLEALEVNLGRVVTTGGTGFKAVEVKTGTFRVNGVETGPGKT